MSWSWVWWIVVPVLGGLLSVWERYPDDVRGRIRVGSLWFGYTTRIPCRFWTDDGPWPYPGRPVAGHLVIGARRIVDGPRSSLEFRSRRGRFVAPPAGLVFVEARPSELPRFHRGRRRRTLSYRSPAGGTFFFEVTETEEVALSVGMGFTYEAPAGPALRRSRWRVLPPVTLAAAVLAAAGAVAGAVLADRVLLVLSSFSLAPALALAVLYVVLERRRWPLESA